MTRFEDALRDALHSDVDAAAGQMITDVRRGARRRQVRRRTAGVVAATVAAVAAISVGGVLLDDGGAPGPQPAPQPSETGTVSASAPGDPLAIQAAAGQVFVTAHETDCDCSAFWRFDGQNWQRLHDFDDALVEQLAMAPDGQNGLVSLEGTVAATHDGGESWRPLGIVNHLQGDWIPAATSSVFWAGDLTAQNTVWRAQIPEDEFTDIAAPVDGWLVDLVAVGDATVVSTRPDREGSAAPDLHVTRDGGTTWTSWTHPCTNESPDSEPSLLATRDAGFVTCPDGSGWTIHRTLDADSWQQFGQLNDVVRDVVPIDADRILVRTVNGFELVTADTVTAIDLGISPGLTLRGGAAIDGSDFVATDAGLMVSTNEGITWRRVGDTSTGEEDEAPTPDSDAPGEPIESDSLPPAGSVPTTIPDDFPLADEMPTEAGEPDQPGLQGPSRSLAPVELTACGTTIGSDAAVDRLVVQYDNIEYRLTRQLATYADANEAIAAVQELVTLYRDCPAEMFEGVVGATTRTADRTDVGGASWALASTQGVHLLQTHVIRVGLAVLIIHESSEGGGGPDADADRQRYLDEMTTAAAEPIAAMCRFTADGC